MGPFFDEYDYLVHLVRCAIHNDAPSELPDGAMFDSVYNCAVSHEIANIAFYSIKKLRVKPEAELYVKWEAKRNASIKRDINQSFARDEILEKFKDAGIRSIEVQGTKLKALYPRPEYRTMSDIDFIIEPENLDKAARILEELGYRCRNPRGYEVDGFRKPNIIVEIHTEYFPVESEYYGKLGDPFEGVDCLPGESVKVSDEILYLYSVLHIAKHYFGDGCGIRRILDLYYLNKCFAETACSDSVNEALKKIGVMDFVADASKLAEFWFGEAESEPDERLAEMIEVIKASGVHGTVHQRLNNRFAKEKEQGKHNIKVRYVFRRLFPEKWVMLENYPMLKKHPVLMPFCWFHRSFKAITKNRRRITGEMKDLRNVEIKKK